MLNSHIIKYSNSAIFRAMKTGEKIKQIRNSKKISREKLAPKMNTTGHTIYRLERGEMQITEDWLERFAKALDCSILELIDDATRGLTNSSTTEKISIYPLNKKTVPVVGYVGAGQMVFPIDSYQKGNGMEEVICPPDVNPNTVVALKVKGDSMLPAMQEGWIIYYNREVFGMNGDCLNKLCVIGLHDDSVMVKELRKGYKKDAFNLHSYNAPIIEDVKLKWCAPVLFIKPT